MSATVFGTGPYTETNYYQNVLIDVLAYPYNAPTGLTTDATFAIQSAIDVAYLAGGGTVVITQEHLVRDLVIKDRVKLVSMGGGKLVKNGGADGTYVVKGIGTVGVPVNASGSITKQSSVVSVTTSAGFVVGEYVLIRDDTYVSGSAGRNQEINRVVGIPSGISITLERPTIADYTSSPQVLKLTPVNGASIEKLIIEIPTVAGGNVGGGVYLQYAVNCSVRGNTISGMGGDAGVGFDTVAYSDITRNYIQDGQNLTVSGYGYGVELNEATHHCAVAWNIIKNVRENTFTNRTRFCEFLNNICSGVYDTGFNTHGAGVTDCLVQSNLIDGVVSGYGIATGYGTLTGPDERIDIIGNTLRNIAATGVSIIGNVTHQNQNIRIKNNTIENYGISVAASSGIAIQYSQKSELLSNTIKSASTNAAQGIYAANLTDLVIGENTIRDNPNGYGLTLDTVTTALVRGNSIRGISSYNVRTLGTVVDILLQDNVADDTTLQNVLGTSGVTSRNNSWDIFTNSATYDPANLPNGSIATTTVTVTGAALGDYAQASFSLDLQGIVLLAYVSAANTVTVKFQNNTGGAIDLASGTIRVRVLKP